MKRNQFILLLFFSAIGIISCGTAKNSIRTQFRQLQNGNIKEDTSYAYSLPYANNTSHYLAQGYFSRYSHKNRAALDFKMKRGTGILAAREGVVIRVKEDGRKGGWNKKYRPDGNFIVLEHADGSKAGYWHIQHNGAVVNVGDSVQKGQLIAYSGKTGLALFPHLHFLVWHFDKDGHWQQNGTRFKTSKGIIYLRPYRKYCNSNFYLSNDATGNCSPIYFRY